MKRAARVPPPWPSPGGNARRVLALIAAFSLLACAALARREKVKLGEERKSRARELDAAHVAAESYRHFEQALARAEALPADGPEREDHASEARLWLEAAISEAETAALARERLSLEREAVRHDEAYLAAERARLLLESERERALAADIAREEMQRALARAAQKPNQRARLSADETRRAAQALLQRAELIALALSPSVQAEARAALLAQIEEARGLLAKSADEALRRGDQALLAGLALVGKTRRAEAAPSVAQKASLAEALALLGASVVRGERGLTATLSDKAVEARGSAREQGKNQTLARLCGVARDYPAGDVQVIFARAKKGAQSPLSAHGCEGARFLREERANEAQLSFTFLAY